MKYDEHFRNNKLFRKSSELFRIKMKVISMSHLSRGWSKKENERIS